MDRLRTYYDLFGVGRNASARQIRAAYLRLLKTHHPDVAADPEAGDFIRFINSAYRALSDPSRRAAYDAELAQRNRPNPPAKTSNVDDPVQAHWLRPFTDQRPGGPTWRAWAAVSIAAVAGAAVMIPMAGGVSNEEALQERLGWFTPNGANTNNREAPLPHPAAIFERARFGSRASPALAVDHSERCFAEARAMQSLQRADLCIIFDDAFLYARNLPQADASLPPRFNPLMVKLRHSSLLAELGASEVRIDRLWEATFASLLAEVRAEPPAVEPAIGEQIPEATAAAPLPAGESELPHSGTIGESISR